jgi:hypothetical protein
LEVDGDDVRSLAATTLGADEPAIGGALRGRFDLSGTVGRPRAVGEVEWQAPTVTRTSFACGEPRRRTLALAEVRAKVSWRDGRVELSDLVLERIPLERVLVDFLCQDYAVAGPLDLTGTLALSPGDPLRSLSGRGRFHVSAGTVVGPRALALVSGLARAGAGPSSARSADLPATLAATPLEFDAIDGAFEIEHGVVSTRDTVYTSPSLTLRAKGTYALAGARVSADVVLEHERRVMQAKVTGSVDSLSIRPTQSLARNVDGDRPFKDLLKKFR